MKNKNIIYFMTDGVGIWEIDKGTYKLNQKMRKGIAEKFDKEILGKLNLKGKREK